MDLVIDCENGLSADTLVGALLDLGADQNVLLSAIDSLNISGFVLEIEKLFKNGTPATNFNIAIKNIIESSALTPHAKNVSYKIFEVLAVCIAKACDVDKNEVVFNEIGTTSGVVDVIAFAICLDNLGVENVYFKNLRDGSGKIKIGNNVESIPTPIVKNICKAFKLNPAPANVEYELITPTGLACVAVVGKQITDGEFKAKIHSTGYGASKNENALPAILKAELINTLN